jgi:hypothetical protein
MKVFEIAIVFVIRKVFGMHKASFFQTPDISFFWRYYIILYPIHIWITIHGPKSDIISYPLSRQKRIKKNIALPKKDRNILFADFLIEDRI